MDVITHHAIKRISRNVLKVYHRWSNGKTTYTLQETDERGMTTEILGREVKYPPDDVKWMPTGK
jgi:hypothetical protein